MGYYSRHIIRSTPFPPLPCAHCAIHQLINVVSHAQTLPNPYRHIFHIYLYISAGGGPAVHKQHVTNKLTHTHKTQEPIVEIEFDSAGKVIPVAA